MTDDVGCVPFTCPAAHAVHDVCAGAAFHELGAHASHAAASALALKRPAMQSSHARSDVAVGAAVWRSPAAHTVCLLQEPRPALGWNSLSLHARHAGALLTLVNVPGSHLLHARSDAAVGATAWRSPATHTVCLLQEPWPALGWKSLSPHAKHASALLTLENVLGAHSAQTRSDVAFGAKS